jgi:translation elongation factor EF-1beta
MEVKNVNKPPVAFSMKYFLIAIVFTNEVLEFDLAKHFLKYA